MNSYLTLEKLKEMRQGVKEAFKSFTGDDLILSNTKTNDYYSALNIVMENALPKRRMPKNENLRNFFFNDDYLDYSPNVLKVFIDFISKGKEKEKAKRDNKIDYDINYSSYIKIDAEFIEFVDKTYKGTPYDFYVLLKNEKTQWLGIVKNWDWKRSDLFKIKTEVSLSFKRDSRVSAVIYGSQGCGKSTFLRRLAVECIGAIFEILWITDPSVFYFERHLFKIANDGKKYLLIIDDWASLTNDEALTTRFLNSIDKIDNVRLVIGDHFIRNTYGRRIFRNNCFELSEEENEAIIKEVLVHALDWDDAHENINYTGDTYKMPLFIILFVLARVSETNKNKYYKTDDVLSIFKNLVVDDQNLILSYDKGISLALMYYASLCTHYNLPITWNTFLYIVNCLNQNSSMGSRLIDFPQNDPLCKVLSRYISLKEKPGTNLKNKNFIYFHHTILLDILSQMSLNSPAPYDDTIEKELMDIFVENGEIRSYDPQKKSIKYLSWESITKLRQILRNTNDEFAFGSIVESMRNMGLKMPDDSEFED